MKHLTLAAALMIPTAVFAAGSVTTAPPKTTETTQVCEEGKIFAVATDGVGTCLTPEVILEQGLMTEQELLEAVRELSYNGRYNGARDILPLLDQSNDIVQTYWGFTARKLGDMDAAMAYYETALALNPNNLLARSYMGQAHVELGNLDAATVQLAEIKARGGTQTWPAISLSNAIRTGRGYSY